MVVWRAPGNQEEVPLPGQVRPVDEGLPDWLRAGCSSVGLWSHWNSFAGAPRVGDRPGTEEKGVIITVIQNGAAKGSIRLGSALW